MNVIKGRCGTACNTCQFKEKFNCGGCVEQEGKIFWGECDIYKCATTKGFKHCGECKSCQYLKSALEKCNDTNLIKLFF